MSARDSQARASRGLSDLTEGEVNAVSDDELNELVAEASDGIRKAVEEEREAIAVMADDYGEGEGDGVSPAEFDRRYGKYKTLAASIRARK